MRKRYRVVVWIEHDSETLQQAVNTVSVAVDTLTRTHPLQGTLNLGTAIVRAFEVHDGVEI